MLAVALWLLPFSYLIDGFVYDLGLRIGIVHKQNNNVVVVGIDDESLNNNQLPLVLWHNQLASVIDGITAGGAKRLGIDLIPAVSMEHIAPELDRRLMQAIRSAGTQGTEVILGFSVGLYGVMPARKFAFAATDLGFLNLFPDPDGVVRRQVLSMRDKTDNLAYSSAMLLAKPPPLLSQGGLNNTFINYRQPLPLTVSFLHVLQLAEDKNKAALQSLFKDKIVLIGTTTRKLHDIHKVPKVPQLSGDGFIAGVHILALMTSSLESQIIIREPAKKYVLLLLCVLGVISTYCFLHWPPFRALILLTGLMITTGYGSYLVFRYGYVIPASAVLYGITVPAIIGLLFRLTHEYQLKSTLNRFFRSYVNLERFEYIMEDPRARLKQERELKSSIKHQEQILYYQPKVDIKNGSIVGMEALVRWIKPDGSFVPPEDFIPLAEETGLVSKLTEIILEQASSFAATLGHTSYGENGRTPRISVNLSARDLERTDLVTFLQGVVAHQNINPGSLDLEITESSVIQGLDEAIEKITALQGMGFTISIDDFGTGYSSLGYITRIPFNYLKIDKSLIDDMTTDQRSLAVVQAIIAMAQGLGAKVIAEGVEEIEQLLHLQQLGCDQVQGYIFSKPLGQREMLELIRSGKIFDYNPKTYSKIV